MRRKSERNKAKASPEKPEKARRGRPSKRRRKSSSSSEAESGHEEVVPREDPVATRERDQPEVWRVEPTDASGDAGEIRKLKICLARPVGDSSPRGRKKLDRSASRELQSESSEEKRRGRHRSRKSSGKEKEIIEPEAESENQEADNIVASTPVEETSPVKTTVKIVEENEPDQKVTSPEKDFEQVQKSHVTDNVQIITDNVPVSASLEKNCEKQEKKTEALENEDKKNEEKPTCTQVLQEADIAEMTVSSSTVDCVSEVTSSKNDNDKVSTPENIITSAHEQFVEKQSNDEIINQEDSVKDNNVVVENVECVSNINEKVTTLEQPDIKTSEGIDSLGLQLKDENGSPENDQLNTNSKSSNELKTDDVLETKVNIVSKLESETEIVIEPKPNEVIEVKDNEKVENSEIEPKKCDSEKIFKPDTEIVESTKFIKIDKVDIVNQLDLTKIIKEQLEKETEGLKPKSNSESRKKLELKEETKSISNKDAEVAIKYSKSHSEASSVSNKDESNKKNSVREDSLSLLENQQKDVTESENHQNHSELRSDHSNVSVASRKRKWGSRSKLLKSPSVNISTDSLKNLIPKVDPVTADEILIDRKSPELEPKLKRINVEDVKKTNGKCNDLSDKEVIGNLSHRKISIINEESNKLQRPPSPPVCEISSILYITNLVRPFTLPQLKNLLQRTGRIVENRFWIDKIKSKCYVQYETEDEAIETRHALHGVTWPVSNPKTLNVDFGTKQAMDEAIASSEDDKIGFGDAWSKDPHNRDAKMDNDEKVFEKRTVVREWDLGKGEGREEYLDHHNRHRDGMELERRKRRSKTHSPSPARKFKKKEEEPPSKLLDDLFKKTKTTPCIYWLPLDPEVILIKEEQRRKHMAEHERRLEELRKAEEQRMSRHVPHHSSGHRHR